GPGAGLGPPRRVHPLLDRRGRDHPRRLRAPGVRPHRRRQAPPRRDRAPPPGGPGGADANRAAGVHGAPRSPAAARARRLGAARDPSHARPDDGDADRRGLPRGAPRAARRPTRRPTLVVMPDSPSLTDNRTGSSYELPTT